MRRGCQKQLETFSSITFKNRFKKRRHWMLSKSSIIWNNGFPFPWFAVLIPAPQSSHAWTEVAFLEKMEFKNLDQVWQAQKSAMLSGQLQNAGGASFSTTTWLPSLGPAPSPLSSVYSSAPGASSEAKLNISGVTKSFKKYHGLRQASSGGVEALWLVCLKADQGLWTGWNYRSSSRWLRSLPCHQAQAPHQSGLLPGIGEEFNSLTCFKFSLDMKLIQPPFSGGNLLPGSGHHPIVQHTPPHYWQLFHLGR